MNEESSWTASRSSRRSRTPASRPTTRRRTPTRSSRTPSRAPRSKRRIDYDRGRHRAEARGWVRRGFAALVQDVRGRHASPGEWHPYENEAADGTATARWIRGQPCSDGRLVAVGASCAAHCALARRVLGPREPVLRLDDPRRRPCRRGVLRLGEARPHEGIHPPGDTRPDAHAPTPRQLPTRRSAPPPLRGTPPRDVLRALLATAVRASADEISWCAAVGEPQPELVESAPDGTLRRLAAGEARPTLAVWAARQAWLAEAGAVLLAHGCPSDADTPQIRRAHLRAGFAAHLAHVAALRHGLAARPVGSWQQADPGAALGAPPGRDWIVHGLALGTTHPDEEKTS